MSPSAENDAGCPAPEPCDPDCESGPIHCPNVHLPRHKWHAHPAENDAPHKCCLHTTDEGEWCCICEGITAPNPYAGTPLAGWADALRESDEAMDETLAAAREVARATGAIVPERQRCICNEGLCLDHCRACNHSGRDLEEPCIADPDWEPDEDDLGQTSPIPPADGFDARKVAENVRERLEAVGEWTDDDGVQLRMRDGRVERVIPPAKDQ